MTICECGDKQAGGGGGETANQTSARGSVFIFSLTQH
jgi:hypothetical protein